MSIPKPYRKQGKHKFFYFFGLSVFLYAGLKVSDYSDRYLSAEKSDALYESILKTISKISPRMILANSQKTAEPKTSKEDKKTVEASKVETKDHKKPAGAEIKKEPFFDPLSITSPSEVEMLEALGKRRDGLEVREKKLAEKELQQGILDKKLKEQLKTLKAIQEEVNRQLIQLDKAEIEKEKSLTRIYESMKPKEAARVIDALDLHIAIGVLKRMNEKKLAAILVHTSVERARDITNELSQKTKSLAKEKSL